jgi:hypothetical protein
MSGNRRTKSETSAFLVYGQNKWQWQELENTSLRCIKELSPGFNTEAEAQQWADEFIRRK